MSVVLACDLGSSSLRVALVDAAGDICACAAAPTPVRIDQHGVSEVDPQIWWQTLSSAIDTLQAQDAASFADIAAVALSAITRTQVFLGSDGQVLRPAMLWGDIRAGQTLAALRTRCPRDHPETANLNAYHSLARVWWFHCIEPDVAQHLAWVMEPKDYLQWRLTGEVASDTVSQARLTAAAMSGPDGRTLFDVTGLSPRLLPPCRDPVSIMGRVSHGLDGALGRLAGTPVITLANDTWASVVGLGAMRAGYGYNISGTTEVLGLVTERHTTAQGLLTVDWTQGLVQLGGPSQTGGDTLVWLLDVLGAEHSTPGELGVVLDRLLAGPRDPAPVLFLPYLQGERVPYWNPTLRGALVGLNRRHGPTDLAYAVLEGVACVNRIVLERAEQATGHTIQELRMGGGGAINPRWCQIKADMLGRRVAVAGGAEPGLIGAAAVAWTALGRFGELQAAQDALVRVQRQYEPNAARRDHYDRLFAAFRQAEAALQPLSEKLASWPADVA